MWSVHVKNDESWSEGNTRSKDDLIIKKNSQTLFGFKGQTIIDYNYSVPFI